MAHRFEKRVKREDGEAYIRKCQTCNCWFGTPVWSDSYCCPACEEKARKYRQRRTRNAG